MNPTANAIAVAVSAIITIVIELWPRANDWFHKYTVGQRKAIILVLNLLAATIAVIAGCNGVYVGSIELACSSGVWPQIFDLAVAFMAAFIAGQSTHKIAKVE